jgi:hypothetical protein
MERDQSKRLPQKTEEARERERAVYKKVEQAELQYHIYNIIYNMLTSKSTHTVRSGVD